MNTELLYRQIVEALLVRPEVETGRMLASDGLRYRGKYFALLNRGALVVKLPAARVADLERAGRGSRFDPGHGRLMREWLAVPASHGARWQGLAEEALEFARQNAR